MEVTLSDTEINQDHGNEITDADQDYFDNLFSLIPPKFFCDTKALDEAKNNNNSNKRSAQGGSLSNKKRKHSGGDQSSASKKRATAASSLSDLQQKLHDKLAQLRENRHAVSEDRATLNARRQQAKDKRHRRKQKSKQEKHGDRVSTSSGTADTKHVTPSKPVYNKDGHIVFSKFDFTQDKSKKNSASDFSGKNYKKLLLKVQKRNEKEKRLAENDKEAAKTFKEKTQWQTALQKAEGQKVKDNPDLLKKSIKRKEKQKAVSTKKWEERNERTEKRQREKQDKRRTNIKKKKEGRINKKIKRSKKKGHIIPGF